MPDAPPRPPLAEDFNDCVALVCLCFIGALSHVDSHVGIAQLCLEDKWSIHCWKKSDEMNQSPESRFRDLAKELDVLAPQSGSDD
jgi:hypothetical protein